MLILFSFGSEMQRIFFWSSTPAIHASTRQASSKSHGAFPSSLTRSTRNKQGQRRSPGPPAKDSRREICSYNEHLKEKPRFLTGGSHRREGSWTPNRASRTKMTRQREKWVVPRYRTSLTRRFNYSVAFKPQWDRSFHCYALVKTRSFWFV